MLENLERLLDHLAATLEESRQVEIDHAIGALDFEPVDRPPWILCSPLPDDAPFKPYPHGAIFDNPEKMLFNELVHAFDTSIALRNRVGDDLPATVRANFGTVLIASMFGAPVEQIGDNPPWSATTPRRFPCSRLRKPIRRISPKAGSHASPRRWSFTEKRWPRARSWRGLSASCSPTSKAPSTTSS